MRLLIQTYSGNQNHFTIPKIYVEMFEDFNTAVLFNQMIFWSDKSSRSDGFFYKTYKEWEEEIHLSEYQVRRSANKLEKLGFLEKKIKRANGSPTAHYRIHMQKTSESILKFLKNQNRSFSSYQPEVSSESLTEDYTEDYTEDNNNSVMESDNEKIIKDLISYYEKTFSVVIPTNTIMRFSELLEQGFESDAIKKGYDYSKSARNPEKYAERIFSNWRQAGTFTVKAIESAEAPKQKNVSEQDLDYLDGL